MIKVLHFSPHAENDGIAKYQEQYLAGMAQDKDLQNTFFGVTPLQFRHQSATEQQATLQQLTSELSNYDLFHVQHEFGLFFEDGFQRLVAAAKASGVKIVVSVHLSPGYAIKRAKLPGLGPRSLVNYLRQVRYEKRMRNWHTVPLNSADLLLVHNDITAQSLVADGAEADKIVKIPHPVYAHDNPEPSKLIAQKLSKKSGDIIYCTVGMLHRYKGIFDAVRALKFLPGNYKLAIIGGMHPLSDDVVIYNKICNLIDQLGLHERVYITGFVKDDHQMNAYIRECDVAVFPYDNGYYGHLSSGSINLALANHMPTIAYPTAGFSELAASADGGVVLCDTFAYYELARTLQSIDRKAQAEKAKAYADKMAWPKLSRELIKAYKKALSQD